MNKYKLVEDPFSSDGWRWEKTSAKLDTYAAMEQLAAGGDESAIQWIQENPVYYSDFYKQEIEQENLHDPNI